MAIAATMKNVSSTISITGFEISLVGLSLTSESTRTRPVMTDIRRPRPTAFALSLTKPIRIPLEVREYRPERQEGQEGEHDKDEDAPDEHEREGDAVCPQAPRLAAPLPAYHRAREGEHQPYGRVAPDEYDHRRGEVEEQGVRR